MSKTWFITGTSRGFGRSWTQAALKRGDRVAATARDVSTLQDLVDSHGDAILPITLDVTDRAAAFAAVRQAHEHFGRLDVVVNNAGYGHFGFVEEVSETEARDQIETNLFGALWVTQAAVPLLREQGAGHILQVSSIGGVGAFPGLGLYHASKWGLEGFSEALSHEVAPFGVKVTIIEPGGYATDWSTDSAVRSAANPAYQPLREARAAQLANVQRPGPEATDAAILAVVDSDNPPLRLLLSGTAYDIAQGLYANRLQTWAEWEDVTRAAG
ncbi:SDR family oxidoreductase [Goodfellowiella coeruleoviolacea]|uniref:NADP-dependent 3-hydroxy acid dehydrogenase YdfG n=1 Tax=Goodfellowiella coeruleoviolacea TaxID=334858 RepID=A0AAE3G838_9PSEU|nr:SDR family oxidoreductase [Goodfellowiella coeruleoviolacea]MCP2163451.1 NADP-dependent 3-hydroxy acid dehydrogenase YdfG [Goodfellowiella coeruleoviolacea]